MTLFLFALFLTCIIVPVMTLQNREITELSIKQISILQFLVRSMPLFLILMVASLLYKMI